MRPIPVWDFAGLQASERAKLESQLQALQTLADVLSWVRTTRPQQAVVEIITQDEYTHDVVVAGAHTPYLVFDTT